MDKFDDTKQLEDASDFPVMQDKISLKSNAKGELQAEVRIGGDLSSNDSIDEMIKRQKHAWEKLRTEFPNIKISGEEK